MPRTVLLPETLVVGSRWPHCEMREIGPNPTWGRTAHSPSVRGQLMSELSPSPGGRSARMGLFQKCPDCGRAWDGLSAAKYAREHRELWGHGEYKNRGATPPPEPTRPQPTTGGADSRRTLLQPQDLNGNGSGTSGFLSQMLFFEGRSTRCEWWFGLLVIYSSLIGVAGLTAISEGFLILAIPVWFLGVWMLYSLHARRWHDHNKSGWWSLVGFIPILGPLWMFFELGCLGGTDGPNDYGPAPGS